MKKFILLLSIIALFCQSTFAQTGGLNFQGIARNASGAVLANQKVNLKFSILKMTETGAVEYTETKEATTNAQGIFAVVVGEVNASSFATIDWKQAPKFLKVEMDPAGGTSFVSMGTTRLQNVPFAYYASGVNANNIDGTISVAKGGTGATDAAAARTNLGLGNVENTADAAKAISTTTQAALDLKANAADVNSALVLKANAADVDSKAPLASPTFTGTVSGITKGMVGLGLVDNTTDAAKPISAATQTALDLKLNSNGNAASATKLSTARNINGVAFDGSSDITVASNAGTLTGTVAVANGGTGAITAAAARTNLGLVIGTNVQAPLTAGTDYLAPTGSAANLTNFPTLNQNTTGNAASATIAGNITATSNATLTTLSNLNTVGTITSGVWSGTLIPITKGGTGSSTKNFVDLTSAQTVAGAKSFTGSIVVGTSTGTTVSAALEVKSTTQGFLPPRMRAGQRDSIPSPEQGLVVYCTNCGSRGELEVYNGISWVNLLGNTAQAVPGSLSLYSYSFVESLVNNSYVMSVHKFDGNIWTYVSASPINNNGGNYVGQIGNNYYSYIYNGSSRTMYSFNGITWSPVSTSGAAPTNLMGTYSGVFNNKAYHLAYNGTSYSTYSFDGTTWEIVNTVGTAPPNGFGFYSTSYNGSFNNISYFTVNSGSSNLLYSFNGSTWTSTASTYKYNFIGQLGNTAYLYYYNGTSYSYAKFDGTTFSSWSPAGLPSGTEPYNISFMGVINNKLYTGVYNQSLSSYVMYYFDGNTFTSLSSIANPGNYYGGFNSYFIGGNLK